MKYSYININNTPIDVLLPADEILLYEFKNVGTGTLVNNLQADFLPIEFDGYISEQFKSQLYNQVHLLKNNYDLGYVSEYTEEDIEVWNAHYSNKVIESIEKSSSDFEITNSNTLPIVLTPNTSEIFKLEIQKDGEVIIDESFTFTVSSQEIIGKMNGIRANLFDFNHSWVADFQEKFYFYTSILTSINLEEQRMPLIDLCNYSCQYSYRLKREEKQKLDAVLYNNINSLIALPLYNYIKSVNTYVNNEINVDLKNSVYQENMQILIKDRNKKEILTIQEIDLINNKIILTKNILNTYQNPYIVPVILSRTINVSSENLLPDLTEYSITFEKNIDDIDMLKINNDDVVINKVNEINYLENLPNFDMNFQRDYNYNNVVLTNEYGIKAYYEYNKNAEISFSYNHLMFNKNHLSLIKKIFNENMGQWGDLYINNFNNDIKIIENINISDTMIEIENINASVFYKNKNLKYIVVNYMNTKKIFEFNNIYKVDNKRERIVLTGTAGININKDYINYTNFLYRGRFGTDDLNINYKNNNITSAQINFVKNVGVE